MCSKPSWLAEEVKGLLLDIYGVLITTVNDQPVALQGSVDAVKRLKDMGVPVRFCTNESQMSQRKIVERLVTLGFSVDSHEVISPLQAAKGILKKNKHRPYVIVHERARDEFQDIDQNNPNCVLIGDACDSFSYQALNEAFTVLMDHPILYTMGYGRYYSADNQLTLDVGCYSKALEFAANVSPVIVGKPSKDYFMMALDALKLKPEEVVMIGDDIVSDVKGAQDCGMRGIQVRTGKYRISDEPHPLVTPDGYIDNIKQGIDLLFQHQPRK